MWLSYLYSGNSYTGKTASFYWKQPLACHVIISEKKNADNAYFTMT